MANNNLSLHAQRGKPYQPPPRREQVLIVVHADGWIECYGERHIDVRIAMFPAVNSAAAEILSEEYVSRSLPDLYRRLYWPTNRRAAAMLERVRPCDLVLRQFELDLLASIDRAGEILQGTMPEEVTVWTL